MSEQEALLHQYMRGIWFRRRNQVFDTKLGYFRVQVVNGRWWIIDPQGQPFLSMGICHISHEGRMPVTVPADANASGHSLYQETVRKRYGDGETWAKFQARRLRRWGFNTVGSWSSREMFQQGLPYTVFLGVSWRVQADVWLHGDFPDVFAAPFERAVQDAVAEDVVPYRDDPLLIGYFTDNELDWNGWRRGTPLFDYFLAKEAATPGKRALVDMLRDRYGGQIAQLNQNWDVNLRSFDDLLALRVLRAGTRGDAEAMAADRDAYLRLAAAKYFGTCEKVIRAADPNHMILGVRFAGAADMAVVEECGKHVDIVSYNNYSYNAPAERIREISMITLRPVMITEWSFKAMDAGLPNTKGAAIPVYTQSDRADGYERYVTQALSLPYVVGLHWFQYTDQPVAGRSEDGENSNYGVVDQLDEPHCTLVERMRTLNARAIQIAKTAPPLGS